MNIDIRKFYLNTTLDRYEYMLVKRNIIPEKIIQEYKLQNMSNDRDMILIEIQKGMYGLPQADRIAYDKLVTHLATGGYLPTAHTPGLFKYNTLLNLFCLVVDNFGIHQQDTNQTPP